VACGARRSETPCTGFSSASAPVAPASEELATQLHAWYPEVTAVEQERIATLVEAYCTSELAARVAGLEGIRPEVGFAFELDGVLLNGRLDAHWSDGTRALVLDYKTNLLGDSTPEEVVADGYTLQRLVYALACLRTGVDEVEVAYHFLERPESPVEATFTRADVPALEAELSAAIARVRAGEFRPTPSDFACADCPALDLVCAGPRLAAVSPFAPVELAAAS
jgi:ATP-dependent helicase/nuclease subunit A